MALIIACMFSSSESLGLQQHPRLRHSRAGGGAVHSIKSEHQPSHSIKFAGVSQFNSANPTAIRPAITAATATKKRHLTSGRFAPAGAVALRLRHPANETPPASSIHQ